MKYLMIKNKGEICESAFVLMGASSKRGDDTKIGFFGTGIKYAIATMVREGIPVQIYSGKKEITIQKATEQMRGRDYETLIIGGRQTSITTEMGAKWKVWQAIREIYCNALDEASVQVEVVDACVPEEGTTCFFVGVKNDVQDVINAWDDYFSFNRTDAILKTKEFKVYSGRGKMRIYRKGICCYESEQPSMYHYDLDDVEINESRLIDSPYMAFHQITTLWQKYATTEMIRRLVDHANSDEWESKMSWTRFHDFNQSWLDVVGGRKIVPREVSGYFVDEIQNQDGLVMPGSLANALSGHFREKVTIAGKSDDYGETVIVQPTKKHEFLLAEVRKFFDEVGLKIEHPIEIAIFKNARILGKAEPDRILIAVQTFDLGKKVLAATILEEAFHLESQCADETRAFQDFLINKLITMLEERHALFL